MIKISIPTSYKEFKELRSLRLNERKKANQDTLSDLYKDIKRVITSNYWSKDISKEMIDTLYSTNGADSINVKFMECQNKLK